MDGTDSAPLRRAPLAGWPYALVCTLLGLGLAWVPKLFHGPAPAKYDVLYINGSLAVWAFYGARLLVGFWVGITRWPARWWLRGPLCGFATLLPHAIMLFATPGCHYRCGELNLLSGTLVGTAIAGIAFLLTGRHRG